MEKVTAAETEPGDRSGTTVRRLAEPLGAENLALNHYELAPGEVFADGLHAHMDQEELFYVLEGVATFETMEGTTEVEAGEAVRFAPGEFQQGRNESDGVVRGLALGAPRDSTDVRVPVACTACSAGSLRAVPADEGFTFACPDCEATFEELPVQG
jgi:uncharacterized cupin superfamily protein